MTGRSSDTEIINGALAALKERREAQAKAETEAARERQARFVTLAAQALGVSEDDVRSRSTAGGAIAIGRAMRIEPIGKSAEDLRVQGKITCPNCKKQFIVNLVEPADLGDLIERFQQHDPDCAAMVRFM